MDDSFAAVVGALWESLGLAPPRLEGEAAVLRIDGRTVRLARSPDERHVVVTVGLGPLAQDTYRREEQVRTLLRDGLGTMLTHRAAVRLADAGGTAAVEIVAAGPSRVAEVAQLRALIEDALHLADIHAPTLAERGRAPQGERRVDSLSIGESLIFRP